MSNVNYGINNEIDYVNFFKNQLKKGIRNYAFKGENGVVKIFKNIVDIKLADVPGKRSSGFCNKGDIILSDKEGKTYPISIKMDGVKTSWESADSSLKHLLYKFIGCYGRINIPRLVYVKLEEHDEDLEKYVFGDDIIKNNGCIIVQTFNNAKINEFNKDTIILNCFRVFNDYNDVEQDGIYQPVVIVRKDSKRNKKCPIINGYRIEVIPNYISTHISNIVDMI